jgi:hypothetical protein
MAAILAMLSRMQAGRTLSFSSTCATAPVISVTTRSVSPSFTS